MDHQVDGLILTVADVAKSATLDDLDSAGMPYVLVYNESASHPYASVDNRAAACDMVTHLAQLGHKRIALVTGPLTASDRAATPCRRARLRQETRPGRRPAHQHELAHRQRRRGAQGRAPTTTCWPPPSSPTWSGWACRCPPTSRSAASTACASARLLTPPLTTVAQPSDGIGQAACSNLLAQIHGQPAQSNRLPHCIVVGGTAAAVR